jgi:50S ribosomal subunit-associated GTPase HflX
MIVFVANREIRKRMYTLQAELKLEQTQRVNERHQRFKDAMFGVAVYRGFTSSVATTCAAPASVSCSPFADVRVSAIAVPPA